MGGVYGDMLLAWTEQQRSVTVFDMTAGINGGWTVAVGSEQTVTCVFQNTRGSAVKNSNGNLVRTDGRELWTRTAGLGGKFLSWEGEIYRLNDGNNWSYEGGFHRYGLERVVGNNATESDDASWNIGGNSFG